MINFFTQHKIAILISLFVGIVCISPQLVFIQSLGDEYRGVNVFATPNEEAYIAIIQEVLDGHPRVASMPFFEYKDKAPLLPSTLFRLYTLPVHFFNVSLQTTVILGKFIFPALLFFVVYLYFFNLLGQYNSQKKNDALLISIATGLLVVFGFEFVDYRSMISFVKGMSSPEGFLIWTRPVNPISGAILLFFFLFSLNTFYIDKKKKWVIFAGLSLGLMMASYVFSWTIATVILGFYLFGAFVKKNWYIVLSYLLIFILAVASSLPYWITSLRASQLDWYAEAAARIGLFYTHAPHINKFTVAVTVFFVLSSFFAHNKKLITKPFPYWWWSSFALLLSSYVVYNQQVVTGFEIWYYHYVFYTIPIGYIVCMLLLWHIWYRYFPNVVRFFIIIFSVTSVWLGIFYQVSAYAKHAPEFAQRQYYIEVFDFFNAADKDCVVLTREQNIGWWSTNILAFTHCNTYYSGENQSVVTNPDDFYYRYMATLRVQGVQPEDIEAYMISHEDEVKAALQFQLQRTLGFPDDRLEQRLLSMPSDYREFVKEDLFTQLNRFRIDYILSEGELDLNIRNQLPQVRQVFQNNGVYIYAFIE